VVADRSVRVLPIDPGLTCLRGLSPRRLRFEVEYGLERGTSANSFLFSGAPEGASDDKAQDSLGRPAALLVHPPGTSFAEPYLAQLSTLVPADTELQVVVSNVNPNRVALLHQLAEHWRKLRLIASNPGAQLLRELWTQRRPAGPDSSATSEAPQLPPLPPITVVRAAARALSRYQVT
jgi:flavorubredoxin